MISTGRRGLGRAATPRSRAPRLTALKRGLVAAGAATLLALPLGAQATNGYFQHAYGTKGIGFAGAGVAAPMDSMAAANNPAGMVRVGDRLDIGISSFSPFREYSASRTPPPSTNAEFFTVGQFDGTGVGPQSIESENEIFLIPHFGWNHMIDSQSAVGVSVYANGGMNTEYEGGFATFLTPGGPASFSGTFGGGQPGSPGQSTAGVDLSQLFIAPSYSRTFAGGKASWGVSAILAYQLFEARGLGAFQDFSQNPQALTDNNHDTATGFGARFGVQGEVVPGVTLGASYQTEVAMSEFDDYEGLFAEGGDFDVPPNFTVGLAWETSDRSLLAFDIQHIMYSEVASVGNDFNPAFGQCFQAVNAGTPASQVPQCLGGDDGPGFGWDDITVYKLGYQWETAAGWTWRAGYSHAEQPIKSSEVLLNILAPGVIQDHITFGFTKEMSPDSELDFGFMYALEEEVSGDSQTNPNQEIELSMDQLMLSAGWAMKF